MELCGYRGTRSGEPCRKPVGSVGWCGIDGHPHRASSPPLNPMSAADLFGSPLILGSETPEGLAHALAECRTTAQDLLAGGPPETCFVPSLRAAAWGACPRGSYIGDIAKLLGISIEQEDMLMQLGRATHGTIQAIASSGDNGEEADNEPAAGQEQEATLAKHVLGAAFFARHLLANAASRGISADELAADHPHWVQLREHVREATEALFGFADGSEQRADDLLGIVDSPDRILDRNVGLLLTDQGKVSDEVLTCIAGLGDSRSTPREFLQDRVAS